MAMSDDGGGGAVAYQCPIDGCDYVSHSPESVEAHVSAMTAGDHSGTVGRDVENEIEPVGSASATVDATDAGGLPGSKSGSGVEAPEKTPVGGSEDATDAGGVEAPEKTPVGSSEDATDEAEDRVARQWSVDGDRGDGGDVEQADVPEAVAEAVVDSLDDQGDDHGDGAGGVPVPTMSTLATAAAVGLGIVVVGQLLGGDDGDDPGDDQKRPDQPRQGTVGERWQGVSR